MALTGIDKVKLNKYLKEHANGDIYYLDMCDYLGKRNKISDIEFLEHFTDCVIKEFSKDGKISLKQAAKLLSVVGSFVEWIHEAKSEFSEETLDKIRSFGSLYEEYLTRNNARDETEFRSQCLGEVVDLVNKLYPSNNDTDSLAKYVIKVKELEGKIKELERTIEDLNRENGSLQGELEKSKLNVETATSELSSVREELKAKKKYLKGLEAKLEEFNSKLDELENSLIAVCREREDLLEYKNKFEELSRDVSRLEEVINDFKAKEEQERLQKEKDNKIKNIIYQNLFVESCSINDLLTFIEREGFSTDISEVTRLLREMKSKINIGNGKFGVKPTYKIVKPKLLANGKFFIDVPCECKHMDVMLVSDFHIKDFDSKTLSSFDMLNDYCAKNGINLILNLGDFYHGFGGNPLDYECACKNYKIVEDSIKYIPKADGIYHAVLGGNHERNMAFGGINPIKMLTDEREDFIDLGYYHSTVCLDNTFGTIGQFDLHHPSNFDFPIDLEDDGLIIDGMNEYLKDFYSRYGRNRDDSYIDIFGHTHRNQFNKASGNCYIPPFLEGKVKRGACHLRIYFDEDTGIKYMVFMPLGVTNKLVKNNEIVYQKVLSR